VVKILDRNKRALSSGKGGREETKFVVRAVIVSGGLGLDVGPGACNGKRPKKANGNGLCQSRGGRLDVWEWSREKRRDIGNGKGACIFKG